MDETLAKVWRSFSAEGEAGAAAMAMEAGRTVKDVSPHEFVKAYSSHLKRSGKVFDLLHFFSISFVDLYCNASFSDGFWSSGSVIHVDLLFLDLSLSDDDVRNCSCV